jgi:hypothetical protein
VIYISIDILKSKKIFSLLLTIAFSSLVCCSPVAGYIQFPTTTTVSPFGPITGMFGEFSAYTLGIIISFLVLLIIVLLAIKHGLMPIMFPKEK